MIDQTSLELQRVDRLLDDDVFFGPFVPFWLFDPRCGRPYTPMKRTCG